jgi:hypothetical protein
VLGTALTVGVTLIGASAYSSGTGMAIFGFSVAPSVFFGLMAVWFIYDIIVLINVNKVENEIAQQSAAAPERAAAELTPIEVPCRVTVSRLSSMIGAAMGVRVLLNGAEMGTLKSGSTLEFQTSYRTNELKVIYDADLSTRAVEFEAVAGGSVQVVLDYARGTLTAQGLEAGWFPDPGAAHELRYWDGARWTEHVSDSGTQAVDPLAEAIAGT